MNDFNPLGGEHDERIVGVVLEHIEVPLRTLVALEDITRIQMDGTLAIVILTATMEEGVADLVTSALALITASWQSAGLDLGIGDGEESPEVNAWCGSILDQSLAAAKARWLYLKADYAANVGPIPN